MTEAQALDRSAAVGCRVYIVLGERQRLGQQLADARFIVDNENSRTIGSTRRTIGYRGRGAALAARPLRIEPCIDIAFTESPLPSDAHRRNLPRLDQPVDRAEIDLEVLEYLFGR